MKRKYTVEITTTGMKGEVPRKIQEVVAQCVRDAVSSDALATALTDAGLGTVALEKIGVVVREGERRSSKKQQQTTEEQDA